MSDRTANSVTANGRGGVTHNGASLTADTSVILVAGQRTAVVPKVLTARKRTKNGVLKAPTELWLV